MARPFSKRIKIILILNKGATFMIYLMIFAVLFKIKKLFLIGVVLCGLCLWIASLLGLFREKYSRKKSEVFYQELEKLPHRQNKRTNKFYTDI